MKGDEVTPAESAPKPSLERRVNSEPKVVPEAAVCFSYPPVNEKSINFPRFPELAAELQLCVLEMVVVSYEPIVDFKPARSGIDLSILRANKFMYENVNFAFFSKNVFHFTNAQVFVDRMIEGMRLLLEYPCLSLLLRTKK